MQATEPYGELTGILRGEEFVDTAGAQACGDLAGGQPGLVSRGNGPVRSHWRSASHAVASRSVARGSSRHYTQSPPDDRDSA
jgi:hypothetical protein